MEIISEWYILILTASYFILKLMIYIYIYQDLKDTNDEMDFSGYDLKKHKCYDATNKKVLGQFKDEVDGKIMTGFLGLRPKCYAFKIHGDDKEYKKV